jgi:hypothetical protein
VFLLRYGYKFAAGSNNISYNSINKKGSFNFNQYYNESYYYIKFPLFVNPYGGGDAAYGSIPVLDFVGYVSLNTVFGRIDGRRFGVVCFGIVGDVQYIFTRVPTFLIWVTY